MQLIDNCSTILPSLNKVYPRRTTTIYGTTKRLNNPILRIFSTKFALQMKKYELMSHFGKIASKVLMILGKKNFDSQYYLQNLTFRFWGILDLRETSLNVL